MRTFLICPVRHKTNIDVEAIVDQLEHDGWKVYWPKRDTDQIDPSGLRICKDNLEAIRQSDIVHVVWDGESQGCLFDLGIAFALGKHIIPLFLPPLTDGKSFQNMIEEWAKL